MLGTGAVAVLPSCRSDAKPRAEQPGARASEAGGAREVRLVRVKPATFEQVMAAVVPGEREYVMAHLTEALDPVELDELRARMPSDG